MAYGRPHIIKDLVAPFSKGDSFTQQPTYLPAKQPVYSVTRTNMNITAPKAPFCASGRMTVVDSGYTPRCVLLPQNGQRVFHLLYWYEYKRN